MKLIKTDDFFDNTMNGFASGMTMNALRGGQMTAAQVATDAFGNALGNSIVDRLSKPTTTVAPTSEAAKVLADQLKSQLNFSPENAAKAAEILAKNYDKFGIDDTFNMGASEKSKSTWEPKSKAQQSAYENLLSQDKSADNAADVASIVAVKERVEQLQASLAQIRESAPDLARQIESFTPVFEKALLAKDVYYDKAINELLPSGYMRLQGDGELGRVGLRSSDLVNDGSGYFAAVYQKGESYVLANRGTEEGAAGKKDWLNNFLQGTGQEAPQYTQAIRTAHKFSEATGGMNISFTGHSLGGGLAMAQALVTGTQATVFNAAAVHIETIKPYGVNFSKADQLIKAYNVQGEVLNFMQDGGKFGLAA